MQASKLSLVIKVLQIVLQSVSQTLIFSAFEDISERVLGVIVDMLKNSSDVPSAVQATYS